MKNKDILKYANFSDKFVCRNGDIAIYLWMNGKEGYSLQLENVYFNMSFLKEHSRKVEPTLQQYC